MSAIVVVVGGGPAGSAAAIGLARQGVRPVVIDAGSSGGKVGECLPPLANPILEELGVASKLESTGHLRSYGVQSAWGTSDLAEQDFLFTRYGPGWHIDRPAFEAELATVARAGGAKWLSDVRLTGVTKHGDHWTIALDGSGGSSTLDSDFLIDATGRRAVVAKRLGVIRTFYDRLLGVEAIYHSTPGALPLLFSLVESVPNGWWYSAPLPGGRLSVIYMTDADLPTAKAARTSEGWQRLLAETRHTNRRVKSGNPYGPLRLRVASAATSRLAAFFGSGWMAVGDAAATFDPLSSHGIYSALAGGYQAGRAIGRVLAENFSDYSAAMDAAFRKYLALRNDHYSIECRWPTEPFWCRRHRLED